MKKIKAILFYFGFCGATLIGCTQTTGHFTPTMPNDPDNAIFYIYRPAATTPGIMKPLKYDYPDVLIDGRSIGSLKYNEYLATELTPGTHAINITGLTNSSSGWEARDIERTIKIDKRERVFMKLRVEYDLSQMNLGQPGAKYHIHLIPIDAEDAKYEIRNTDSAKR